MEESQVSTLTSLTLDVQAGGHHLHFRLRDHSQGRPATVPPMRARYPERGSASALAIRAEYAQTIEWEYP